MNAHQRADLRRRMPVIRDLDAACASHELRQRGFIRQLRAACAGEIPPTADAMARAATAAGLHLKRRPMSSAPRAGRPS